MQARGIRDVKDVYGFNDRATAIDIGPYPASENSKNIHKFG